MPLRIRRRLTLLAIATAAFSAPAALPAVASAENFGDIIINEFRTHGPGGANDEYVELKNTTSSPINLRPSGSNRMWAVEYWVPDASDPFGGYWEYFFFDFDRVIPANSRLLLVNKNTTAGTGYSLDAYRPGDLVYNPAANGLDDIPSEDTGIVLWSDIQYDGNENPGNLFWDSSSLAVDEAGYSTDPADFGVECDPWPEDDNCPGLATHGEDTTSQYAFVRKAHTGVIQDTDNTIADWNLVGLNGQELLNGLDPIMGAPGPQGLNDPHENFGAGFFRIDASKSTTAAPNRVISGNTMFLNREVKNNTGATINTLKIRWIDLTTRNSPGSENLSQAILKPVSAPATSNVVTASGTKTVRGAILDPVPGPPATSEGGLNSSMSVALPAGGVPPCSTSPSTCSVNVQIKLIIERTGTFKANWWPEVK